MAQPATPNINTYLNALNHLDIPDGEATGDQLNFFLNVLQRAAAQYKAEMPTTKQMIVFGKEVAYMNATQRGNILAQAHNALNDEDKEEQNEKEAWRAGLQLWGTCQEAVFACKGTAINLFLIASHPNLVWENSWAYRFAGKKDDAQAKAEHYARRADWHAYAVKIQDRQAWIYDSSYEAVAQQGSKRRRLHQISFMKRVWDLIQAYKSKALRIDKIFLGGGGNNSDVCQDMACRWMRGEVMSYMGSVDSAIIVDNWEEITL